MFCDSTVDVGGERKKYSKASRDTINVSQKKSCPAKSLILRSITIY